MLAYEGEVVFAYQAKCIAGSAQAVFLRGAGLVSAMTCALVSLVL